MRVVIDAMAASRGGLATYVRGLVRAWGDLAPSDELTVLLTEPFGTVLRSEPQMAGRRLIVYEPHRPSLAWRLARIESAIPRLQHNADVLLATIPTVPVCWQKPSVAVVHDLRHEHRPGDFGIAQRFARATVYRHAYRRAEGLIAVSQQTAADLADRHPDTIGKVCVIPHGADHIPLSISRRSGYALAFGHFANKEAALLLHVWRELLGSSQTHVPRLCIVGLGREQLPNLSARAASMGVGNHVVLRPYVDPSELAALMRTARAVLLPARHEGFGLPVLEAMRQGVPVVISPDPALQEVAAGHAACASSWSVGDLAAATRTAFAMTLVELEAARLHASRFTWRRAAASTQLFAERIVGQHAF